MLAFDNISAHTRRFENKAESRHTHSHPGLPFISLGCLLHKSGYQRNSSLVFYVEILINVLKLKDVY